MRSSPGVALIIACAAVVPSAYAQATAVPCRDTPCSLVVDWGVGKSVNDMPPDRKYGAPAEFEVALREALRGHDMIAVASAADSKLAIRVQAAYRTGVLCDDMPGTTPDRSCATIGEAIANFGASGTDFKGPTSVRMINRCGATNAVMTMKQFGKYAGEMIWFALEGEQKKAAKPSGKC